MYRGKRIAVNVSAYNEEKLIERTLREIPDYVDIIVVVDDNSTDATCDIVNRCAIADTRIKLIQRCHNSGFGGVTIAGYEYLMNQYVDIIANLNGDGQMDVEALEPMIDMLVENFQIDMVKGDRLSHRDAGRMPFVRRMGGRLLSRLTSYVTGYEIHDSQHTYHVINVDALRTIRLGRLYKRFGYPNDFLIECAKQELRVKNHPARPIYGNGEESLLKPLKVAPRILSILAKGWLQIRAAEVARKLDINQKDERTFMA